ncbi:MAG: replicative DNA helicase [Patescibacteria group bacterium]
MDTRKNTTSVTTNELSKIPPHNLEAEQATLGSLLIDKDAIIKIADMLTPDDFYSDKHKYVYDAIQEVYKKREPIDVISLANVLDAKEKLDQIGGRSFLISLTNVVPTASNIVNYANIVQKKATLRRLIQAAQQILAYGYEETDEVDTLLDNAEQQLFKVSQKYLTNNFVPLNTVLTEAFDRIDEIHKEAGKLRGVPTGFAALDNKLGGMQKSDLLILAARPSLGKTSLALDIARRVAVEEKIPVGIFSLEMSKDQLVDRLLCAQANVDLWKMRTGKLSDSPEQDDFPRIGQAMGVLSEAPLFIDDTANLGVMEIRTKARRLQMEHGLGLLVIDYLQLMEGRSGIDNRVQEIAEISRALKGIARELNIPVLALSQLSRAVEAQNVPIPKLSHLRESGSIEQDADVVMFIYREDYYDRETEKKGIADIIIAKHRNGPTGQIELFFDMEKASFQSIEKHLDPAGEMPPPEATPF